VLRGVNAAVDLKATQLHCIDNPAEVTACIKAGTAVTEQNLLRAGQERSEIRKRAVLFGLPPLERGM
jgi:hypothetical protein